MKVWGLCLALVTMAIVVGLAAPVHAASPDTQDAQGLLSANHSRLSASLDSDLRIVSKPVSNTLGRIRRQQTVPYQASYSGVLCAYAVRQISNLFAATNVHALLCVMELARLWHRGPPSSLLV